MRIFKALVISSLSIPLLVFVILSGVGLVFMVVMLVKEGEYDKGWFGMVYAGAVYSYFALLLSSIPTMVLGWPASVIADRYGYLSKKVVLFGSALLGGVFLGVVGSAMFKTVDTQVVLWLFLVGTIGGLFNGVVFLRYLKPNDSFNSDANSAALHLRRLS
jgi:hypothetical protein